MPLVVLAAAAALLLAQAAVAKLRHPAPTARALLSLAGGLGLHPRPLHVLRATRLLGLAELAVVALVLAPGVPAASGEGLLAAAYAGFTIVVLTQLRTANGEAASCGCFGADVPLGPTHVVVNAVLAIAAGVTAGDGAARPLAIALDPTDSRQATLLGLALLVTGLAWAALTALPALQEQVAGSAAARLANA